jgi:hypothetical protein
MQTLEFSKKPSLHSQIPGGFSTTLLNPGTHVRQDVAYPFTHVKQNEEQPLDENFKNYCCIQVKFDHPNNFDYTDRSLNLITL